MDKFVGNADRFVARDNIRFLQKRVEVVTDPTARSLLQRILIDEEDKLGHDTEALHEIETLIAGTKEHVSRQQALLASSNGHDTAQVVALLNAYSEILLAYQNQREKILAKLERGHRAHADR